MGGERGVIGRVRVSRTRREEQGDTNKNERSVQ